jgi:transketolase
VRKQLCDALVARSGLTDMVFLTGDLGFMALEPLKLAMGPRFINAGVAEQNMVSVAAAMAREGLDTWVYSIAPFVYARPFEQIRNDVAFHGLPVKLIGNGGGYGYGVMGPTHHAIDDYGSLLTLPNMTVFIPVFDEDVESVIERAGFCQGPAYLRMGRGEPPKGWSVPAYAPWRKLTQGHGPVVVSIGPLAGTYVNDFELMPEATRPNLWAVAELPSQFDALPPVFLNDVVRSKKLVVAEEHVQRGSVGVELASILLAAGVPVGQFRHLYAKAHHYERYGSQGYLRLQSHLDSMNMRQTLEGM